MSPPAAERAAPTGVFETLRAEDGALSFLEAHLARLERGARAVGLPWPPPQDPRRALCELARALGAGVHALRLTYARNPTRGAALVVEERVLEPLPAPLTVLVAAPGAASPPLPAGVKSTARAGYDALRAEARQRGAWEALVLALSGELVEGTVTNVFVARAGELATPPLASGALPGVVRAVVLAAARLRGPGGKAWTVVERPLALDDLARAEEVLLTNSLVRLAAADALTGAGGERADLPGVRGPVAEVLGAELRAREAASAGSGRFPGGAAR